MDNQMNRYELDRHCARLRRESRRILKQMDKDLDRIKRAVDSLSAVRNYEKN